MQTKYFLSCLTILVFAYFSCASEVDKMPEEQWKSFKAEHGKSYSDEEDAKRFKVFLENLKLIEDHNKKYEKGEVTYTMGLNKFTDWFPEEKSLLHGAKPKPPNA